MKIHTNGFKQNIKLMGKEIDSIITYNTTTLHDELYSVSYHYEGNLLKSIMKQLDIESSVDIPINTVINYQLGLKVDGNYEYLDYGNYVVVSSEKQEDLNRYKITCYDKMVYSMKQNEDLGLTYPISLKNYLIAIGNAIGLEVENTTFANQNRMIPTELYAGLEYTYRDILDEIAQATGSNIIINSNDKLEVKYINNTQEIIDEEFLKDINVTFKEKFGAVNTIVLSRSGEADNIYYPSPLPENPIELKIVDNQIMNRNDRDEYLPELYSKLNGVEFYLNDFNSTGICYLEPCDLYNIKIGENTYKCLMLNDEINITSGLEEIIHTEIPEQGETDYTKADKTDRRINQTYLIVDKQNQTIEAVVTNVGQQNQKISKLTQDVDELKSEIQDIADVTESKESTTASVSIDDVNESEPVRIVVHPIGTNISFIYPNLTLYPSSNQYMPVRILRFNNTTTDEIFDYELPNDLLYYDAEHYDEFILDYEGQSCVVNKRVGYNADGTTYVLANETTIEYEYPRIELTDGDYTISLIGYEGGYLFARMMIKNIYTDQFATKAQLNSAISQTMDEINLSVDTKLTNYVTTTEMSSAIDIKANQITSSVSENYETKVDARNKYNTIDDKFGSYYTKSETNSQINQKANEITSSVSQTYITKTDSATNIANAKSEAISSANSSTDAKLQNYSTTTQMNSAINQKANEITSSVSATYITKTDSATNINTAKNQAINSANASTDTKLQSYSTTTQMNSAIDQKANQITSSVSQTYETKTDSASHIATAKSEAIASSNASTDTKLTNYYNKSTIDQKTNEINLEVEAKLDEEDFTGANIILAVNNDSSSAVIDADKVSLARKNNRHDS